jgi:hypothetical protein
MIKTSKSKLAITGIIAVAIGIGASVLLFQESPESDSTPRTVFWRHIHGLGVDPADRSILYIATHGDFYQSISGGPPVKVDEERADYMAFNAPYSQGVPLYASGHPATGGNTGLIKSTDGGKTWQQVATVLDPPVDFHAMAISKSNSNLIIGFDSAGRGLFKTTDAGKSWERLEFLEYMSALAISPTDSNLIFAGTGKGIFVSNDGASTWTGIGQYDGQLIFALAFDENGIIYASTEFGLSRSADLGQTWEKIRSPDLTITSIAADAQNNILYIAGYVPDGYQEVYKSPNDGNSWDLIATNREL